MKTLPSTTAGVASGRRPGMTTFQPFLPSLLVKATGGPILGGGWWPLGVFLPTSGDLAPGGGDWAPAGRATSASAVRPSSDMRYLMSIPFVGNVSPPVRLVAYCIPRAGEKL